MKGVIEGGLEEMRRLGGSEVRRDVLIVRVLIEEMRGALKGVRTLKGTYSEDTYYCCGIDTYIELIEAELIEYEECKKKEV